MEKLNGEEFNCLLERIDKGNKEWNIEKVLIFDGFISDHGGDRPYQEWEEILICNPVEKEYFYDEILIMKGKSLKIIQDKMYLKRDFDDAKWKEIEKLLTNTGKKHFPVSSNTSLESKLFVSFIVSLALVIAIVIFYKHKRK